MEEHIGWGDFEVIKWGGGGRGKSQRAGSMFMGKLDSSRHHVIFLAIVGGLGWMKWLKNWAGKILYFMKLFLHYILFAENFIG